MPRKMNKTDEIDAVVAEGEPAIVAYLVTARVEGFRRAGRAWSRDTVRVEAGDLTDGQVATLLAEPMLTVEAVAE